MVTVDGLTLLVAMYCSQGLSGRIELLDAVTGAVLDSGWTTFKEWWFDPERRLRTFTVDGIPHVAYVWGRGGSYQVERVTLDGFVAVGSFEDDLGSGPAVPAVVGGEPVVATHGPTSVRLRHWRDGHPVCPMWTAPSGWTCDELVAVRGGVRVWLTPDGAGRWDQWLWDPVADRPAGPPLTMRGYRCGPWTVDGHPLLLYKVDWRDWQLWDLARRAPLGPGLGDLGLENPAAGVLHGRPVLAGILDSAAVLYDVGTGRQLADRTMPHPPLATAVAGDTLWAVDTDGGFVRHTVPVRDIHPSALRAASAGLL